MEEIKAALARLGTRAGMAGCALVERGSGMVWYHHSDRPDMEQVAEAAVEFFRSPDRLQLELRQFGDAQSVAYSFEQFVISLHPCQTSHDLVLVCLAHKQSVQWAQAAPDIQAMRRLLQRLVQ